MDEKELLQAAVDELRKMLARAAYEESRAHGRLADAEGSGGQPDGERLRCEWLLGRFSGIAEALELVEGFAGRKAG